MNTTNNILGISAFYHDSAAALLRDGALVGANYERLAAVKATYDLDNLFHLNQNIAPANGSWASCFHRIN